MKLLIARSGDHCAFSKCAAKLSVEGTPVDGPAVLGEMAHIKGEKPGAARYDKSMTDKQRNAYQNLIYLCRPHHRVIDQQANTYTVEMLIQMKNLHEKRVRESLAKEMPLVTFAELEVVTKALLGVPVPITTDFSITNPAEKMRRNELTQHIRFLLTTGLAKAREVNQFVDSFSMVDSEFPERLRSGFLTHYKKLHGQGMRGDALFESLQEIAAQGSKDLRLQAAGLAILGYLFEKCEVFEL